MKQLTKYYNSLLHNPWKTASCIFIGVSARDLTDLIGNIIGFLTLVLIFWCLKEEKKFQ